jgi:hypothetical protein
MSFILDSNTSLEWFTIPVHIVVQNTYSWPQLVMLLIVHTVFILKAIIKKQQTGQYTGTDTIELNRMSDCKFYLMQQLQMYVKVLDYTPVRSQGFLNVCMLGKQLAL